MPSLYQGAVLGIQTGPLLSDFKYSVQLFCKYLLPCVTNRVCSLGGTTVADGTQTLQVNLNLTSLSLQQHRAAGRMKGKNVG